MDSAFDFVDLPEPFPSDVRSVLLSIDSAEDFVRFLGMIQFFSYYSLD